MILKGVSAAPHINNLDNHVFNVLGVSDDLSEYSSFP